MSRICLIEKEKKKFKLNFLYKNKILEYKNIMKIKSCDIKYNFISKLQEIPRNAFKVRQVNRCLITGRSRGFFRRFGLSRHIIKDLACKGELPGLIKSSW